MFCAIVTAIERCKTEGVVDVFQVVKALRVQKPGAVTTMVSYAHSLIRDIQRNLCPSLHLRMCVTDIEKLDIEKMQ